MNDADDAQLDELMQAVDALPTHARQRLARRLTMALNQDAVPPRDPTEPQASYYARLRQLAPIGPPSRQFGEPTALFRARRGLP